MENETGGDSGAIRLAVSVCLHQREAMEVGGCEWVFAACANGAPTLYISSPRSVILRVCLSSDALQRIHCILVKSSGLYLWKAAN